MSQTLTLLTKIISLKIQIQWTLSLSVHVYPLMNKPTQVYSTNCKKSSKIPNFHECQISNADSEVRLALIQPLYLILYTMFMPSSEKSNQTGCIQISEVN